MKRTTFVLAVMPAMAALALAACKKEPELKAPAASGEVLPGSVSDAMLDTDTSQAEAPVLTPMPTNSAKAMKGDDQPEDNASGESPAATETTTSPAVGPDPKPSATPSAKPTPKPAAAAKPKPSAI